MSRTVRILFGPPGTGKTSTLLDEVDLFLAGGTPSERIGFFSFSRRAIREAKDRAMAKFSLSAESFPWFRTIHSAAYHMLELNRGDVIQQSHLRHFFGRISMPFSGTKDMDPVEQVFKPLLGDRCYGLYHLARARQTSLSHEWAQAQLPGTGWNDVIEVARLYERFKDETGLRDFSDMLEYADGDLPLDVLFIDEAQDCSPAQWAFLRKVSKNVPLIYIAGDDDQTIYRWSGADSSLLFRLQAERQVLPLSHRLPSKIKTLADMVAQRIQYRVQKDFHHRQGDPGRVFKAGWPEQIDLHDGKSWLLLARTNRMLARYRIMCRRLGVVYSLSDGSWSSARKPVRAALLYERLRKGHPITQAEASLLRGFARNAHKLGEAKDEYGWPDLFGEGERQVPWFDALVLHPSEVAYIRALRKSGESLTKAGRVRISTVHGAKGTEADSVVINPQLSRRVIAAAKVDPDAELRVQYVAITRAKSSLYVLLPKSTRAWTF